MNLKLLTTNEHTVFEMKVNLDEIPGVIQRKGKFYRYLSSEDKNPRIDGEVTHTYIETSLCSIPS